MYWQEKQEDSKPNDNPWWRPYYRPRSADIEITAYALLAFSLNKDISVGLAISRWLSQQRNSLGGYSSTQVLWIILPAFQTVFPTWPWFWRQKSNWSASILVSATGYEFSCGCHSFKMFSRAAHHVVIVTLCFPALRLVTGSVSFSIHTFPANHPPHVFPRCWLVTSFPRLPLVPCCCCMFSLATRWFHVFPRLSSFTLFTTLGANYFHSVISWFQVFPSSTKPVFFFSSLILVISSV